MQFNKINYNKFGKDSIIIKIVLAFLLMREKMKVHYEKELHYYLLPYEKLYQR